MKIFHPAFGQRFRSLFSWPVSLLLLLSVVYLPFLGTRYIRTGGDEKVYVSQALEMARSGTWFLQTLHDNPYYYKGPLHYILIRLGMALFGLSTWAVVYMNFLLVCLGALALGAIVRHRLPDWKGGPLWTGAFFGLGIGVYAHAFASQMEIETTVLYTIGLYFLDRLKPTQAGWAFWTVAGMVGWVKAPLHSVFLGLGAVLYWALQGDLLGRLRSWRNWAAVATGILVCAAAYAPAYLMDGENFVRTFIIREMVEKSATGQGPLVAIVSAFGFYLFPWFFLAPIAYLQLVVQLPRLLKDKGRRPLLTLAFSASVVSVVFFLLHPYRFENYNLPVIGAIILALAATWSNRTRFWDFLYRAGFALTALVCLGFGVFVSIVLIHLSPLPDWWPSWVLPVVILGSLLSTTGLAVFGVMQGGRRPGYLAGSMAGIYLALGAFFSTVGEREMVDLRHYLAEADRRGEAVELTYYNLQGNVWAEWGLLSFWVRRPIRVLTQPEQLGAAIDRGAVILVPHGEGADGFREFVRKYRPEANFQITPWKRWRTHGGDDAGNYFYKRVWDSRDLSVLERDFLIVKPLPARTGV